METLVIGLDGGEWDIIDPLIERGDLPNLAQLRNEGVSGPLESITPPISPPAWNSIQTGVNPGKHGVFDFSTFDENYNRRSINASDRSATPFWTVLNDAGKTTGLFKVPFTYPPSDVNGFMVTGFPTPNHVDDYVSPSSLHDDIAPIKNLFEDWSLQQAGDYEAFRDDIINVADRQTDCFLKLIREHETDFAMTVYDGSDRIQHFFWKYFDDSHPRHESHPSLTGAIEDYYVNVDRGIGRLVEEADENCNIIIISDHGFGPLSHDIYIDEWLEEEGLLSRRAESANKKTTEEILAKTLDAGWSLVKRANLDEEVKSILPSSLFQYGRNLQHGTHRDVIWEDTKAFFTTLSGQSLFINLEDEFTDGTVPSDKYEVTVEAVRESLLSIQHPETGDDLVEAVIRSDEEFHGWKLEEAPDLIVRTAPEYTMKGGRSASLIQPSTQNGHDRSGDHRSEGILIASGPAFGSVTYEGASILDVAPTLLYLQECPIPNHMDGKVLMDLFANHTTDGREIAWTDKYGRAGEGGRQWSDKEEAELEKQLSDMGYLN